MNGSGASKVATSFASASSDGPGGRAAGGRGRGWPRACKPSRLGACRAESSGISSDGCRHSLAEVHFGCHAMARASGPTSEIIRCTSRSSIAPFERTSPAPPVWRRRSVLAIPTRRSSSFHPRAGGSKSFATAFRSSRSRSSDVTPGPARSWACSRHRADTAEPVRVRRPGSHPLITTCVLRSPPAAATPLA